MLKIPEWVTEEDVKRQIEALETLYIKYKKKTKLTCPLCLVSESIRSRRMRNAEICSPCPWLWFKGIDCCASTYSADSIEKRMRRIKRWIKRLNKWLETGK